MTMGGRPPGDESHRVADEVTGQEEAGVPADLQDTWNAPAKAWDRDATDLDPFEGVPDDVADNSRPRPGGRQD